MTPQISYLPELPTPLQYLARLFDAIGAPTRLIYRDAVELPALVRTMLDEPGHPAAAWTVPLAVLVMVTVSRLTPRGIPRGAGRTLVRLHTPEEISGAHRSS